MERGLEFSQLHNTAIDAVTFEGYLEQLSRRNLNQPFALFMDNLRVHKTPDVRDVYRRLNITPLFNIPYSPDTNPIESCFS